VYINYVNVLLESDKVKYWKGETEVDDSTYQVREQWYKWHGEPPGTKVTYPGGELKSHILEDVSMLVKYLGVILDSRLETHGC